MSDTEDSVVREANTLTTWDSHVKLIPASVQTATPLCQRSSGLSLLLQGYVRTH